MEDKLERLCDDVKRLGFSDEALRWSILDDLRKSNGTTIHESRKFGGDVVNYLLHIRWQHETDQFSFDSVHASLRKEMPFPEQPIGWVSFRDLDEAMSRIPWSEGDFYYPRAAIRRMRDPGSRQVQQDAFELFKVLLGLDERENPALADLRDRLLLKHIAYTPTEGAFDLSAAKRKFEISYQFDTTGNFCADSREMYALLDGRAVARTMMAGNRSEADGFLQLRETGLNPTLEFRPINPQDRVTKSMLEKCLGVYFDYWEVADALDALHHGAEVLLKSAADGVMGYVMVSWDPLNGRVLSRPENGPVNKREHLKELGEFIYQVEKLGWEGYGKYIYRNAVNGISGFELSKLEERKDSRFFFTLAVEFDHLKSLYAAKSLKGSVVEPINLPPVMIDGVDIALLEQRAREVPWRTADFWQMGVGRSGGSAGSAAKLQLQASSVFADFQRLVSNINDENALWIGEAFYEKYFRFTPNEYVVYGDGHIRDKFEVFASVKWASGEISLHEFANMLEGRSVQRKVDDSGEDWLRIRMRNGQYRVEQVHTDHFGTWGEILMHPSLLEARPEYRSEAFLTEMHQSLIRGDTVAVPIYIGENELTAKLQADPDSLGLVVIPPFGADAEVLDHIRNQGWKMETGILYLPVGQVRDYEIHPPIVGPGEFRGLVDHLREVGFDLPLEHWVAVGIHTGYGNFSVPLRAENDDRTLDIDLRFRKLGDGSYSFHQFEITLRPEGEEDSPLVHLFHSGDGSGMSEFFTYPEAVNLMLGGFVEHQNRFPQSPREWFYLNGASTEFVGRYGVKRVNGGFDIEAAVNAHRFSEMRDATAKAELLKSLRSGDIVKVTTDGPEEPRVHHISANPLRGGLKFHFFEAARSRSVLKTSVNPHTYKLEMWTNQAEARSFRRRRHG